MQVERYVNSAWQAQFYGGDNPSKGMSISADNIIYSGGYYAGTSMLRVSNAKNGNEGVLVLRTISGLELTQTVTYATGSAEVSYKWEIKNTTGGVINDVKFFTGGDTYLSGGDKGSGFWDAADNIVGVSKFIPDETATTGQQQNLFLQGVSIPKGYVSEGYNYAKNQVGAGQLKNEINASYNTDNGFAMEWKKPSLAAGETWTILAGEKFVTKNITDLTVHAPLGNKADPGESVDLLFEVEKDATAATSTTFSIAIDLAGWTAVIQSPNSPYNMTPNEKRDVIVRVTIPTGTALGTSAQVTLTATNSNGAASDFASVVAAQVPTITAQPTNAFACALGTQSFAITATDADTYQWQEFKAGAWSNLTNGGGYGGVTTNTLTINVINNSFSGNEYKCVVMNAFGQVQSHAAGLTVDPFSITTQPIASNACAGTDLTLNVVAAGGGMKTYQWKKDGTDLTSSSATTADLLVTGSLTNSGTYTCVVSSSGGCADLTTTPVVLTVTAFPVTAAPIDVTHCEGDMLTLTAVGDAAVYTWTGGVTDGIPFAATTTTTYIVTGTTGGCSTTDTTVVIVNSIPAVSAGVDKSICANRPITLIGSGGADTYSWDNSVTDNVAFTPVAGITTTYTVTGTITTTGCMASDQVTVVTNQPLAVTSPAKTICNGETITLTATPSGGNGSYSYEWHTNLGVSIGTTNTITPSPAATTEYNCTLSDDFSTSDNSVCTAKILTTVTVNAKIAASLNDTVMCAGGNVTLIPIHSGGNGNYTYLWSPGNETTATIVVSPAVNSSYGVTIYDDFVSSNATVCEVISMNAVVTVNALPVVTATATSTTVCEREMVTLTGGNAFTYTWDNGVTDGIAFTPTATAIYTVVGTDANGCVNTASETVNVTLISEASVGSGATVCADTYPLTGNNPVNGSGVWTSPDATITFVNNTVYNTNAGNLKAGNNILIWTITAGSCTSVDTLIVSRDTPLADNAGPDESICDATTYTLKAAAIDGSATGVWTGPGTITNDNDPNSTVTNLPEGANTFTWTVTGNVCSASVDDVVITRDVTQIADGGILQTVCESATTVTLSAITPTKGTGMWMSSNPYIVFSDVTSATSTISGMVNGFNGLTWTTTNGSCKDQASTTVMVEKIIVQYESPKISLCDATDVHLSAQNSGVGTWTSDDASVTFDDVNSPITFAHNLQEGVTSLYWKIDNGSCGISERETVVTQFLTEIADAGITTYICGADTANLVGNTPVKGIGNWTSTTSGVVIETPSSPTTKVSNVSGGAAFFWTITNGKCISVATTTATVNPNPVVLAGPSTTLCAGDSIILSGSGAQVYTWDNGVTNGKKFVPVATKIYTVTGTDATGCMDTSSMTITVNDVPVVDAGVKKIVCEGTSITLAGSGADAYTWTNGVLDGEEFTPTATAMYHMVGATKSCTATDSVEVIVNAIPMLTVVETYRSVCNDAVEFELGNVSPSGGTYSGSGVNAEQYYSAPTTTPGTHTITYVFVDSSTVSFCTSSITFDLVVKPLPIVTVTVNAQSCADSAVVFMAGGAEEYKWEGDSLQTSSVTFMPPVGPFVQTVVGYDSFGCGNNATASMQVVKRPSAGVNSTIVLYEQSDKKIDLFNSLLGSPDTPGTWESNTTDAIDISDPTMVDFEELRHGYYYFTYTAEGGSCPDSSAVLEVKVDYSKGKAVSPSEGLSPNGDGINDSWFIADIELFPNNHVVILNRYGALVFKTDAYANDVNDFDGRANVSTVGTDELPEGTYYYTIKLSDTREPVTGFFTILR